MKVFKIDDIPEFSKKERIVVVGVIGKSPYRYTNKTTPLVPSVECEENGIECHWDERRSILYLHAVTYLDTNRLAALAAKLDEDSKCWVKDADAAHWLVASGELAAESCKSIALLFHLCHIVILSSPTPVFDLGYLQLFKAIDAYRNELSQLTTSALSSAGLDGVWESHGRSCCPRLLFHFRRAPTALRKAPAGLKRLEHAVEDQLYFILRKARIITNVCAKSLFAIPKNEEFVYMSTDTTGSARDVSALVKGLVNMCQGTIPEGVPERPAFRQFLQGHVDLAFGEGFDDNVGKYAMSTSFFELPSASTWRTAAQALTPVYLNQSLQPSGDESEPSGALYDTLATDVRFSQARCAKVLPIAQASYTEGLPAHYSTQHHAHKLSAALLVLGSLARGPLAGSARARLARGCSAAHAQRAVCEHPSITGHPCQLPKHDDTKEHSSGVRYISACNCGRTKCSREDPYSAKQANFTFYEQAAQECDYCDALQKIHFPVFEPSSDTYTAASIKPLKSSAGEGSGVSARGDSDDDTTPQESVKPRTELSKKPPPGLPRQASTSEYLPGLLHQASPPGLLPLVPAWSLVCLGGSSLYSHALGLPDHLQPGFLPHTNFLVPWDCAVRTEQQNNIWRQSSRGRGKSSSSHHTTVKIFIGFEYECLRGHRFMMSSPDTLVSGCGSARATTLVTSGMPLATSCSCRSGAAAARVHVVTPKANVSVSLQPELQPVPGGPIFVPHPPGSSPALLTPAAYWILRLPQVFEDEHGTIYRPRPGTQPGTILAPMFAVE